MTEAKEPKGGPSPFRACSCGREWKEREAFLSDPLLRLVGYQVHFEHLELGLFLFNHLSCGTTVTLRAGTFRDLYDGPTYSRCLAGEKECPEYCLRRDELKACTEQCECAFVREIIQVILSWPKADGRG